MLFLPILVSCRYDSNHSGTSNPSSVLKKTLTDTSHNNSSVSIRYPQLENKNFEKVNKIIKDAIIGYVGNVYGADYINLKLNLDYRISFQSGTLLSVIFEGMGNVSTSAHPNNLFYGIVIDLENASKLNLRDVYIVNNNLINLIKQNVDTNVKSFLNNYYDDSELIKQLNNPNNEVEMSFYLTENKLGLSITVPHAIGDHIESEINYSDLRKNLILRKLPFVN